MNTVSLLTNLGLLFGSVIGLFIIVFGAVALVKQLSRKQPTEYWEDGQTSKKRKPRR